MGNRLLAAAVAMLLLFGFVVAPAQADLSDRLLDALGDAELGYQKDASDYLRMAKGEKDRCEFSSNSYDEKYRNWLLTAKNTMDLSDEEWETVLARSLSHEDRARDMEGFSQKKVSYGQSDRP